MEQPGAWRPAMPPINCLPEGRLHPHPGGNIRQIQ